MQKNLGENSVMTAANASTATGEVVELAPSYRVPLGLLAIATVVTLLNIWAALSLALFGLFLVLQASTLRLRFTEDSLDVVRGDKPPFRKFPYAEWQNWRIYWPVLPILFYFKEVNSIHFLPILFDSGQLRSCLEARCPQIDS